MKQSAQPWSIPVAVANLPEAGGHYVLEADAAIREAVAQFAGLRSLDHLKAEFDLNQRGEGIAVRGVVKARIGQNCIVTLEPIENDVAEAVNLIFAPSDDLSGKGAGGKRGTDADEPAEPLQDGVVDLGAIAVEFLILGVDPYRRKAGAEFPGVVEDREALKPFATLAALKKQL